MAPLSIRIHRGLAALVVLAAAGGTLLGLGVPRVSAQDLTLTGKAYGYWADVSLFGGPSSARGPDPVVELAPDASDSPQEASLDEAAAIFGPAVIFRAGQVDVRTEGTPNPGGSVTSYARAEADLDEEAGDPKLRPGPLLYDALESTCTADEDGFTVSVTVTNGVVETSYDPVTQLVATSEPVPEHPEAGHAVEGTLDHIGDRYRIVYNEQIQNDDGTLTVNAAHMYLLGEIAVGDLIIGQTVCGTSATPAAELPIENTPTTTDATDEADDTQDPDDADAAEDPDETDGEDTANDDADDTDGATVGGVPVSAVGLGLGALVVIAIVVGLMLARRGKAPAEEA